MTTAEYKGLQTLILGVRDELKDGIKAIYTDIGSLRAEMNQRFDDVYQRFDKAELIQNTILDAIGEDYVEFARVDKDHQRRIGKLETHAMKRRLL